MSELKMDLSKYIDHTILKPNARKTDIENLCKEAIKYGFKGVCVNPSFISVASSLLKGKKPIVIAAVGFPLGASQSSTKAFEAKEAVAAGSDEIDMVINIGALKEKEYKLVFDDIVGVVNEVNPCPVKVIIETCFLTKDEIIIACALATVAGALFVKTSTGFGEKGATVDDIKLMKSIVGNKVKIKASGGIKNYKTALEMIEAGASRIGTSSSIDIIKKQNS
jgi:deoxyribose-phosphate aldolase